MTEQADHHHLACACKGVELEITGAPLFQSNCWCSSCTAYHQVTPVPTAMWKSDQISITKGADQLKRCTVRTPEMGRYFCTVCGLRVYQEVDGVGFRGVRPASVDGFWFEPSLHVLCGAAAAEALQQYKDDGLPKYRALPSKFGGSNEQVDV